MLLQTSEVRSPKQCSNTMVKWSSYIRRLKRTVLVRVRREAAGRRTRLVLWRYTFHYFNSPTRAPSIGDAELYIPMVTLASFLQSKCSKSWKSWQGHTIRPLGRPVRPADSKTVLHMGFWSFAVSWDVALVWSSSRLRFSLFGIYTGISFLQDREIR